MKKLRKLVLASLGLLTFLSPIDVMADSADGAADTDQIFSSSQELPWRKARMMLEMQTGSRSIATADAMIPFLGNDDFIVYANLMAKIGTGMNNAKGQQSETNLGLGFRRVNDSEDAIFGAYAFYDSVNTVNNNKFQQVTVGVERLGLTWDFRANAYLPVGETSYSKNVYVDGSALYKGNALYYSGVHRTESISSGGDLEIGRAMGSKNVRAYLAAYSFGGDITGPRARVEYQMNNTIKFTATVQHDEWRGTQYLLGTQVSLGGAKASNKNSIYNRLTDVVVRDIDIPSKTQDTSFSGISDNSFFFVDSKADGGGDGTVESPFTSIADAVNAAPDDTVIFVKGKDGTTYQEEGDIQLKEGQLLWGADKGLYWDFSKSQPAFGAGEDVMLIHKAEGDAVNLNGTILAAKDSWIYNLNLGSGGIVVDDVKTTIKDVSIDGGAAFSSTDKSNDNTGITITGAEADVLLDDVKIQNVNTGIDAREGKLTLEGQLTIENSGSGIIANEATIVGGDVTIKSSAGNAIEADHSDIMLNNLYVEKSGGDGVSLLGGMFTVENSTSITDSAASGLNLSDGAEFRTTDLTINTSGKYGVFQERGALTANGLVSVKKSGYDGLHLKNTVFEADSVVIDITGTSEGEETKNGIYLDGGSYTITDSTIITNVKASGLYAINMKSIHLGNVELNQQDSAADSNGLLVEGTDENLTDFTAGKITINNAKQDGIHFVNVKATQIGDVEIKHDDSNFSAGRGIYLKGGEFKSDGTLSVSGSSKEGFYAKGMETINLGNVELNQQDSAADSNGLLVEGTDGSLTDFTAGKITINNAKQDGIHFVNVNATSIGDITISHNDDDVATGSGIYLEGGSFSSDGLLKVSNNLQEGFYAEGMSSIQLGDVDLDQRMSTLGKSGITIKGSEGERTTFSTNSLKVDGATAFGLYFYNVNTTINGNVSVSLSEQSQLSAIKLEGGSFVSEGNMYLSGVEALQGNQYGVLALGTDNVQLGNVYLNLDENGKMLDTHFAFGIKVNGGKFSAGNIDMRHIKHEGIALNDVTMDGDDRIDSLTITDSELQDNGVTLENSDFKVTHNVTIDGAQGYGIYSNVQEDKTTLIEGNLLIALSDDSTSSAFYQSGGSVTVAGKTALDGADWHLRVEDQYGLLLENTQRASFGNIDINQDKGANKSFYNGVSVTGGTFTAGDININNTSFGLNFIDVTVNSDNEIGDIDIKHTDSLVNATSLKVYGGVFEAGKVTINNTDWGVDIRNADFTASDVNITSNDGPLGDGVYQDGGTFNVASLTVDAKSNGVQLKNIKGSALDGLEIKNAQNGLKIENSSFEGGDLTINGITANVLELNKSSATFNSIEKEDDLGAKGIVAKESSLIVANDITLGTVSGTAISITNTDASLSVKFTVGGNIDVKSTDRDGIVLSTQVRPGDPLGKIKFEVANITVDSPNGTAILAGSSGPQLWARGVQFNVIEDIIITSAETGINFYKAARNQEFYDDGIHVGGNVTLTNIQNTGITLQGTRFDVVGAVSITAAEGSKNSVGFYVIDNTPDDEKDQDQSASLGSLTIDGFVRGMDVNTNSQVKVANKVEIKSFETIGVLIQNASTLIIGDENVVVDRPLLILKGSKDNSAKDGISLLDGSVANIYGNATVSNVDNGVTLRKGSTMLVNILDLMTNVSSKAILSDAASEDNPNKFMSWKSSLEDAVKTKLNPAISKAGPIECTFSYGSGKPADC